jgi:hypothetical protein
MENLAGQLVAHMVPGSTLRETATERERESVCTHAARSASNSHTATHTHTAGRKEGGASARLTLLLPRALISGAACMRVCVCVAVERRKRNPAPSTTAYTSLVRLNGTAALLTYDMLSSPRVQWSVEVALEHTTATAPAAT